MLNAIALPEAANQSAAAVAVDTRLEAVVVPVSDVDRAKRFYAKLGWRLDADFANGDSWRVVQLTPAGSSCSILLLYNGYWFFGRPTVEELRLDLRAVLQRCRPDWDIGDAEHRAAWAQGEQVGFHPYGRTRAQVLADGA